MPDQRTPLDKGAISDQDRAWMEFDARNGRPIHVPERPSRSRIGRILDFFDSAARASRPNHWR